MDVESRFEVLLEDKAAGTTHILAGIIDRIDKPDETHYEIIDYKTQKRVPSQETVDRDMQLSIYAMGLKKRWPHIAPENIKLSLQFLKHDEKLSTARSATDFEKTETSILQMIRDIEERERTGAVFEPVVSPLCDFCGYKPLCPAWKHLYKNVQKETIDGTTVPEVMKEYFLLRDEKREIEKKLKGLGELLTRYLAQENIERIFSDEGIIAKRTLEKYAYDLEVIRGILEPLGKWQDILKADEIRLRRIMKEIPEWARDEITKARKLIRRSVGLSAAKKRKSAATENSDA